ncbi:2977_t:CDS:2 [Acaulospora colombiana]|uniref:2977_t:CDS:1 n=1 Tax=Acaulospora colombiana TaxID=27376 RepID=A0ACA9K3C7_9GLOM|nr:2977_t:CDS:2 [Acaulospora colombiana]
MAIMSISVVVLDIKPPEIEHVNIAYYKCDVSKFEEVQGVARKIVEDFGHPTILVNNAGIVKGKTILDESEAEIIEYDAKTVRTTLVCPGEIKTGMFEGIEVRFPFITPPLAPLDVVKLIFTALEKDQGQDIFVPYYVHFVPALRILPSFVHDLVHK